MKRKIITREKIRKILTVGWENLKLESFLLCLCFLSVFPMVITNLPPVFWKTTQITVADIDYYKAEQKKLTLPSVYFTLIDKEGHKYTGAYAQQRMVAGGTYTIEYSPGLGSRNLQSAVKLDRVYVDHDTMVSLWKYDAIPLYLGWIIVFVLLLWLWIFSYRRVIFKQKMKAYQEEQEKEEQNQIDIYTRQKKKVP